MVKALGFPACAQWWVKRPSASLLAALAGSVLSVGAYRMVQNYYEAIAARPPVLVSMVLEDPTAGGDRWLRLHYRLASAAPCIRHGTHVIYRDPPLQPREYFTPASGVNGAGLAGTVADFTLMFSLPSGFPRGDWTYIFRNLYICPPFGTVTWTDNTAPVRITVP